MFTARPRTGSGLKGREQVAARLQQQLNADDACWHEIAPQPQRMVPLRISAGGLQRQQDALRTEYKGEDDPKLSWADDLFQRK